MSGDLKPLIGLAATRPLTRAEAEAAFAILFEGGATPAQTGGFLMALRTRGETVDEITGAVSAMRAKMLTVKAPADAVDIVGTGGDGSGSVNVSTCASFILAGAGVPVAKHGNRNLSSKSGAADALGALGVNVMVGPEVVERCLAEAGIGFMMAPMHHPATRHVAPVRMELGTRTIFNILGPLTNPAGVRRQLTGAFSAALLEPMAATLRELGTEAAWLVHGGDGSDELSISAPSQVVALEGGRLRAFSVAPEDAGLPRHPFEAIAGGTPEANAQALSALLDGAPGGYRDAVLLNAAAALVVAGRAAGLPEGAAIAAASIDSGAAAARLDALRRVTRG